MRPETEREMLRSQVEIASPPTDVEHGTSADRQEAVFADCQARGLGKNASLAAVVDWIAATTVGADEPMVQAAR